MFVHEVTQTDLIRFMTQKDTSNITQSLSNAILQPTSAQ